MISSERVYKTVHHIQPDRTPVFLGRIDDLEYWDAGYSTDRGGFVLEGAETVRDVETHYWPAPEVVDYEELRNRILAMNDTYPKILSLGWMPVLDTLFDLFGMANTMLNMHEAPELIEAAITHIEYFVLGSMKKAMEYCAEKVEFFWCGEKIIIHLLYRR